jgi:hypothetical protein
LSFICQAVLALSAFVARRLRGLELKSASSPSSALAEIRTAASAVFTGLLARLDDIFKESELSLEVLSTLVMLAALTANASGDLAF